MKGGVGEGGGKGGEEERGEGGGEGREGGEGEGGERGGREKRGGKGNVLKAIIFLCYKQHQVFPHANNSKHYRCG